MAGLEDPTFYGDHWASDYDEGVGHLDTAGAVEFLAGIAGEGRVLELAIGTGRVALPLASRGLTVEGIDASAAMVEQLRAKPGGASIPVIIGDMAEVSARGPYKLVYLVYNSLFMLLSQVRQTECFRNVARVLQPRGLFVIECFVPDLSRVDLGQRVHVMSLTEDSATVTLARHDATEQRIMSQTITFDSGGMRMRPTAIRYSWPSELDLMADQAGLRMKERYSDWGRQPFEGGSGGHVSVYELGSSV